MTTPDEPDVGARSVSIGGPVANSQIATGDHNQLIGTLILPAASGEYDLEVRIGDRASGDQPPYWVSARMPAEQRRAEDVFDLTCSPLEARSGAAGLDNDLLQDPAIRQLGERLFTALVHGPVQALYAECRQRELKIRFRLTVESSRLESMPWELLFDRERGDYLARDMSLVRSVSPRATESRPPGPLTIGGPLRLLLVDPSRALKRSLVDLQRSGRLDVKHLLRVTLDDLTNELRTAQLRGEPFHALHLRGAPRRDGRSGRTLIRVGELDLTAEQLAQGLAELNVKLVLVTCADATQSSMVELATTFSPPLLAAGVSAVCSWTEAAQRSLSQEVLRGFYEGLAGNRPVDLALASARAAAAAGVRGRISGLGSPVWYLAPGPAQLFEIQAPRPARLTVRTWRRWLHQRATPRAMIGAALLALFVAASIATLSPILRPLLWPEALPPMNGNFRIAVAPFGTLDSGGHMRSWDGGKEMAEILAKALTTENERIQRDGGTASAPKVEVRHPDGGTRLIVGDTIDERARAARALADDIKADVIVHGGVTADGSRFVPELYVSDRLFPNTTDPGYYALGTVAPREGANIARIIDDQDKVQITLLSQTSTLVYFLRGLNAYSGKLFEVAEADFRSALDAGGWQNVSNPGPDTPAFAGGKEALYLFLGNSALRKVNLQGVQDLSARQRALEPASAYFRNATDMDADYARALVGLAEIAYLTASGGCSAGSPDSDVTGLEHAADLYAQAQRAEHTSPLANLPTKVAFGLGRTYLCLTFLNVEGYSYERAAAQLQIVTSDFDGGNASVRDWAGEAHLLLGTIALSQPSRPDLADGAVSEFLRALELNSQPDAEVRRKHLACRLLGTAMARLTNSGKQRPEVAAAVDTAACQSDFNTGFETEQRRLTRAG